MIARKIPVEWSRDVEVWHAVSPSRPIDPREDRLVAITVDLPQRFCIPVSNPETETDWPVPVIARAPKEESPAS